MSGSIGPSLGVRRAAAPLMAMAALAAAGYLPTQYLAGTAGTRAMAAAAGVVLVAVYATMLRATRRMTLLSRPADRFQVAWRAQMECMIATLALAAAVAWRGGLLTRVFLVWVAVAYVPMILLETILMISWARRLENRP